MLCAGNGAGNMAWSLWKASDGSSEVFALSQSGHKQRSQHCDQHRETESEPVCTYVPMRLPSRFPRPTENSAMAATFGFKTASA